MNTIIVDGGICGTVINVFIYFIIIIIYEQPLLD